MEVITKQHLIDSMVARWLETHTNPADHCQDIKQYYEKLKLLPPHPTEEQVQAILGQMTGGPIRLECTECGLKTDIAVKFDTESEYECPFIYICPKCLTDAQALLLATPKDDKLPPEGEIPLEAKVDEPTWDAKARAGLDWANHLLKALRF